MKPLDLNTAVKTQQHPFHVLGLSKIPFFMGMFAGFFAILLVMKMQNITNSGFLVIGNLLVTDFFQNNVLNNDLPLVSLNSCMIHAASFILITLWAWGRELVNEATFEGHHTSNVQIGLKYGMLLFLTSEAMLFFPFFWAFFHFSLSPAVAIGAVWPPEGIRLEETLDAFMLPLVNTVVLLTSGVALVAAHRAIIAGYKPLVLNGLYTAISLGILFSWLQYLEYGLTKYTINDSVFGSTFFMLTGLHGFHVIVGTCLLLITYWRVTQNHFSKQHHILFEFAAWYWHFVDVVWLFVFVLVYIWGVEL